MAENKEIIIPQKEVNTERQNEKQVEIMKDLQDREIIVPREVRSWMEKVEQDPDLSSQNQNNGNSDDSVLQPIAKIPKIELPISKVNFSEGFKKTVSEASRWLSEFVFRLIKKNKGNVKFKEK